jgi:UDP-glucose 4-epimerase
MSTILFTGDRGFIAGYVIQDLIDAGHCVIGLDNDWKYGPVQKSYDNNGLYCHYTGDAKDAGLMEQLFETHKPDYFIMGAAIIGGISMFHELAYDLFAENERITATALDTAIKFYKEGTLKKVLAISSSMVYESTKKYPSVEGDERLIPPPLST